MKKTSRKLNCSYLYADGTLVQVFDERRDGIDIAQTVDITRGWCDVSIRPAYSIGFELRQTLTPNTGRIVVHGSMSAFVTLAKGGRVRSHAPDLQSGSENTRSRGIEVQYVEVITKNGLELHWSECVGVLSSSFTVQAGDNWKFDFDEKQSGDRWGDSRIWKVVDLRPKKEAVAA